MTPSAARRLARFVRGLRLEDVPPPVVTKATHLVLDTLGCALAATRYDFGRAALETAERLGGPHESTLVGSKVRVAAANAVLANATLAHGLDFDDTREDAIVHTGSVAITTGLAVGEALGATGPATLAAMVAGVEVMCHQTIEASTGEDGVRLAKERRPALVLMDIQLPGMDGIAALGQLRADAATRSILEHEGTLERFTGDGMMIFFNDPV